MPAFHKENYTIIQQISHAEDAIRDCYKSVEVLEERLRRNELPPERQEVVRRDLIEIRKLLAINEQRLKTMQTQNSKSFAVAAILFLICFIVYAIYILIVGFDH